MLAPFDEEDVDAAEAADEAATDETAADEAAEVEAAAEVAMLMWPMSLMSDISDMAWVTVVEPEVMTIIEAPEDIDMSAISSWWAATKASGKAAETRRKRIVELRDSPDAGEPSAFIGRAFEADIYEIRTCWHLIGNPGKLWVLAHCEFHSASESLFDYRYFLLASSTQRLFSFVQQKMHGQLTIS